MVIKIEVGQHVIYTDAERNKHDALVTTVWGKPEWNPEHPQSYPENWPPMVNLVYVLKNPDRTDQYGNQTYHATSVPNSIANAAGGIMWDVA